MSQTKQTLATIAAQIDSSLASATALNATERKKIAYWTLGTHTLESFVRYPILMLWGRFACGKSQTEEVILTFAHKPKLLNMRSTTLATLRDSLGEAFNATIILEEADDAFHDVNGTFERLVSDRYNRNTAQAALKKQIGESEKTLHWENKELNFFGATVLHRRMAWRDAASEGRTITIRFKPNHTRTYKEFDPFAHDELKLKCQGLAILLKKENLLLDIDQPEGISSRIFNTYRPLLVIATFLGDTAFLDAMRAEAEADMARLKEDQESEPDGLILSAMVALGLTANNPMGPAPIMTESLGITDIKNHIFTEHSLRLEQRQIAQQLRSMGFETKKSHGMTRVYLNRDVLIKACDELGMVDEAVEGLRKLLIAAAAGGEREGANEKAKENG